MINNRAKTFITAVAVAIFLMAVSCDAAQDGKNMKIRFGIHITSSAGQSSAQWLDITKGIMNIFKENYGLEVVMKTFPSFEEVEEALIKNEIDGADLWPGEFGALTEKGASIHPWATFQIKKTEKTSLCLWQRKNEKTLNVNDVFGKRLIGLSYTFDLLLFLRDYLYRNGVDKPLWNVFRSFTHVSGTNSAYMSVVASDVDYFWYPSDDKTILKLVSPNVAKLVSYSLCSESVYARYAIVMNKKTLSKAELRKLDEVLVKFLKDFNEFSKTNMDIKSMRQYMSLAQMRLVPAKPDEFDYEMKLFENARKRGWIEEADFIIQQMEKAPKGKTMEITPDYDYCRKTCLAGKTQMACIEKCME